MPTEHIDSADIGTTADLAAVLQQRLNVRRGLLASRITGALDEIQDAQHILDELLVPNAANIPDFALAGTPGDDIAAYLGGIARTLRATAAMLAQATAAAPADQPPAAG